MAGWRRASRAGIRQLTVHVRARTKMLMARDTRNAGWRWREVVLLLASLATLLFVVLADA